MLLYKHGLLKNKNKACEIQYQYFGLEPSFNIQLKWNKLDGFVLCFDIFKIISFNFEITRKCDHAGIRLEVYLLGMMFHHRIYDIRHWDYDNDTWVVYDFIKKIK